MKWVKEKKQTFRTDDCDILYDVTFFALSALEFSKNILLGYITGTFGNWLVDSNRNLNE